jgi:hypothetical protein
MPGTIPPLPETEERGGLMELELIVVIGGAWCALLGLVVALMAVASRAEDRFETSPARARRR